MKLAPFRRWILGSAALALAGCALALAAGCIRYGGLEGIVQRVETKAAAYRPHPDLVPTPFAAAEPPSELLATILPPASTLTGISSDPLTAAPTPRSLFGSEAGQRAGADPATGDDGGPARAAADRDTGVPSGKPGRGTAGTGLAVTPLAAPAAAPTATPIYAPARPSEALTGATHYWQTWNNCGPATLAMDLSYFGSKVNQADIARVLRPDPNDKNVNPEELVSYALSQGFQALTRVNGSVDRLRLLVSNGVPVIVETWMEPEPNDGMGHYRLVTGYDDSSEQWTIFDSYESTGVDPNVPYAGIRMPYASMASLWPVFDNRYVVVYTEGQAPLVQAILGDDMNPQANYQAALRDEERHLQTQPQDAFGWFDLGSDLDGLGQMAQAAQAYDRARQIGLPWRMLWYQFGPFTAYYAVGRYQEMVALADATLSTADNIEELYYWKGMALKAEGDLAGARQAWQRAVQLNKNYRAPADALAALGK